MTRKSIQEINFHSQQDFPSKIAVHKNRMPIVRCVCGSEILVVPDLKAMSIAIGKHVAEHKRAHDVSENLTEFLTEQAVIVASRINGSTSN
jgi:hypothetical protein